MGSSRKLTMNILLIFFATCLMWSAVSFPVQAESCNDPDRFVEAPPIGCLTVTSYGPRQAQVLVVFVHGDLSDGGPADYMRPHAQNLAAAGLPDGRSLATAVLVRPGYPDGQGNVSDGSTNDRRDHYTAEVADAVAAALSALRQRTGADLLAVVGHSGGAAITGAILGRHAEVIDRAMLVSCPCDVPRWRRERGRSAWLQSLSPIDHIGTILPTTRITLVTGADDGNTPPALAQDYLRALKTAGVGGDFVLVPGTGHGFNRIAGSDAFKAALADLLM